MRSMHLGGREGEREREKEKEKKEERSWQNESRSIIIIHCSF